MKKAAIIASAAAAVGSFVLGHFYLTGLEAEVSGGPKVSVLAVSKDIAVGSTLKEDALVVREIPQAYVEDRHIPSRDLQKVLGAKVTAGLKANHTVLWSDLSQFSDQSRVLSSLVSQGMRAVPLDGRDVDFGGLLRPGDRVDVLLTSGAEGGSSTRTLLQNLLVLSVGTNIAAEDESGTRTSNRGKVTVSATVEGAQTLAQARRKGQLSLTLRNNEDVTVVEGLPATTNEALSTQIKTAAKTTNPSTNKRERIERVR